MKCSKCGMENADTNKYCVGCGSLLEEKQEKNICSSCGSENSKDSKYCVTCGKNLNSVASIDVPTISPKPVPTNNRAGLGLGIASLAVSIVCCCLMPLNSIVSIILGVISIATAFKNKNSENTVGIILSAFGIIISLFWIVVTIITVNSPEFQQQLEEIKNMYNMEQMVKVLFIK